MFLVFSDIHFHEYRQFATVDESGLNTRLLDQIRVFREIVDGVREHGVSDVFFLGDLFHTQSHTISKVVMNVAYDQVMMLASYANVWLLVGNHDILPVSGESNRPSHLHVLFPFSAIKRVTVCWQGMTVMVGGKKIDLMPWGVMPRKSVKKPDYCFGHFGLRGAIVGISGYKGSDQMDFDPSEFENYKLVMAGHYHVRQQVTPNIIHVGSVMHTSFGDTTEDRGYWLVDPSTDQTTFIPIKSPKFYTVKVTSDHDLETYQEMYNDYDYFRLIITADGVHVHDQRKNEQIVYDLQPTSATEVVATDPANMFNLADIVTSYIQESNTQLDKTILIKKALELLED